MFTLTYYIFLITLILSTLIRTNVTSNEACNKIYNAPCTATHPLGDENLNNNILENPVMNEGKETKDDFKSFKKCTHNTLATGMQPQTGHIPCPKEQASAVPKEIIYSSNSKDIPQVQCNRCNIRLTEDSSAVLLQCYDCYDLPAGSNIAAQKSRSEVTVNTLVYFLEIENYSRPEGATLNLTFK